MLVDERQTSHTYYLLKTVFLKGFEYCVTLISVEKY